MTDHATLLAAVTTLLERTSMDELRAFECIARRVMGKGRDTYGPTILGNDTRDFAREAGEEIADAFWYLALMDGRREIAKRQRVAAFAAANDNDGSGE